MILNSNNYNGKRRVSNCKRHITNVNKPVRMFALTDWTQISVSYGGSRYGQNGLLYLIAIVSANVIDPV